MIFIVFCLCTAEQRPPDPGRGSRDSFVFCMKVFWEKGGFFRGKNGKWEIKRGKCFFYVLDSFNKKRLCTEFISVAFSHRCVQMFCSCTFLFCCSFGRLDIESILAAICQEVAIQTT